MPTIVAHGKTSTASGHPAKRRYWTALVKWALFVVAAGILTVVVARLTFQAENLLWRAIAAADDGPRAVVMTTRHDFDTVAAGDVLRHEFVVQNHGSQRLLLNEVGCPGCGHNVMHDSVIVPPGGEWRIPVSLETAGRCGWLQRVVTIATSDPYQPHIDFTLTARVQAAGDPSWNNAPSSRGAEKSVLVPGPRG